MNKLKPIMDMNSCGEILCTFTDIVLLFFFSQRIDANNSTTTTTMTNNTLHHIATRTNTHSTDTKHQAHFSFQHRYRATSFTRFAEESLHNSFLMRTCSRDREWAKAHALWPSGKMGPCVQREPTGRAIFVIVIVIERVIEREEKEREVAEREKKRDV